MDNFSASGTPKRGVLFNLLPAFYFLVLLFFIRSSVQDNNTTLLLLAEGGLAALCYLFFYNSFFKKYFYKINVYLLIFYATYYLIFGYNFGLSFFQTLTYFAIIFSNIIIATVVSSKNNFLTIKHFIASLLFLTFFVVFIPTYLSVQSLELGAFYNFTDKSLLTVTTMDSPLIAALLLLLSGYDIFFNKKFTLLNFLSAAFALYILMLFSRRGFILSSILSFSFYFLYIKVKKNWLVYALLLFLFLPLFWDTLSTYLVLIADNSIFSKLILRNDTETLLSATGRASAWANILEVFLQFKSKLMLGFHGRIPAEFFPSTDENGRYEHAHNTFLQLFLEGGYFMNIIFLLMLIFSLRNYLKARKVDGNYHNFYFILLIFMLNISATETLIRYVQFTNFIFCFVLVAFNVSNYQVIKSKT